jgi:Mn2+/Fe2+ NRAMP family transporter
MNLIVILFGMIFIAAAIILWVGIGKKPEDEVRVIDTPGAHVEYHVSHYEKYGVWLFVAGLLFAVLGLIWK